ncbi:putative ribonuclease H-like domain-containing protein [Tanacetum coccineum]
MMDILKKFDFATVKTASTPLESNKELIQDEETNSVDVHLYRSMIGSLIYLTASSDYAGASFDRKSTTGGCQFLGKRLISWQLFHSKTKHIEIRHHFIRDCNEKKLIQVQNQAPGGEAHIEQILLSPSTYQRKQRKTQKHRRAKKVTELPQTSVPLDHGADKAVHKKGVTTQAPRYHIGGADAQTRPKTTSKMSRDPPLSEVNTSGHGEDSMEYHNDLTDFVPPTRHDSPLSRGNTSGSDEGRMELIRELMETCTSLMKRVLSLEEAKTAQDRVITRLKLRVKRLEKKRKARTPQPMKRRLFKGRVETSTDKSLGEDASKQGRNDDKTEELNLTDGAYTEVIMELD